MRIRTAKLEQRPWPDFDKSQNWRFLFRHLCSVKKATAILLTFCLLAQCLVQLGMLGLYRLNRAYIAAELCENKARPQLNCCGRCYLNKQLRNSEEGGSKSKGAPVKLLKGESLVYLVPAPAGVPRRSLLPEEAVKNPAGAAHHGAAVVVSVFHPPAPPLPQA